ncbi:MAG: hypothetical protein KDB01_27390 [Planctomycetaceae bacterium]|nr:hypothetical protein [Planctomycetaceae bacterium]
MRGTIVIGKGGYIATNNTETPNAEFAPVSKNSCFESILGGGLEHLDVIREENAERSVSLLTEFIAWLARLPERLPPGCRQSSHDTQVEK